ncbi:MAG: hypothetical protein HYV67_04615 [Candidatus Taylorbacteria bacterium]|nr:hypothetical protein [Candidatus Taylorbacteria bacterium]
MNKELSEILITYTTKAHKDFTGRLLDLSKDSLISLFTDLLTMYINDRNSSRLREYITVITAGYEHSEGKIGFNGYKQNNIVGGLPIACEAKPRNIFTADFKAHADGKRKTKPALLNGGGNFTDYTPDRLKRDRKENPMMLTSGFIDGKLIYILEFPFRTVSFVKCLRKSLEKHFPNGVRKSGTFLRSATFDFRSYESANTLQVIYRLPATELETYKKFFNKKFYEFLLHL